MFILRQSTAKDIKLGPFVDKTDGVTYETGMAAAMDNATTGVRLSKNGAAFADRNEGTQPTYDAFGYYLVKLDATDTNTVGTLKVIFGDAAVCLPCEANFQVVEEAVYDALYVASAAGYGIAQTGDSFAVVNHNEYGNAVLVRSTTPTNTLTVDANHLVAVPATQKVDVETIKTQAITCGAGVTFGVYVGGTGAAALASEVTAERMGALTDWINGGRLDLILDTLALEATLTAMKGATFNGATDSLEAVRDRGDAAWVTATGFSTHSAADVVTALDDGATLTACLTATGFSTHSAADVKTAIEAAGSHLALIKAQTDLVTAARMGALTDLIDGGRLDLILDAILTDTGTTLQGELDGIQADTEDLQTQIGVAGAGLSAIPWNAAWDVEVQSECTDALNAYDPPTNAEIPTVAAIADAVWDEASAGHTEAGKAGAQMWTGVDAILEDTGTTLPATLATIDGIVDDILVDTGTTLDTLIKDIPTVAEFEARTLVAADYTVVGDLGVVQTADHTAAIADIPTVSEFNARSLPSADYTVVGDLGVVQTGDSFAIVNGDHGLVSIQDDIDAILLDTGTTLDGKLDTIQAVTDKLDTAMELDVAVYRFTENALEQAPTGGSAPTVGEIADAVWDEAIADHTGVGTFGAKNQKVVPSETLNDYKADVSALATAADLAVVDGIVDTILVDTNELQTDLHDGGRLDLLIDGVKAKTDGLNFTGTYVDAQVKAQDNIDFGALQKASITAAVPTTADVADKVLGRSIAGGADGGRMVKDALKVLRNKRGISEGVLTVYEADDVTPAWTATVATAEGNPVSEVDPA